MPELCWREEVGVKKPVAAWEYVVGMLPNRVTALENHQRRGVLYLHWRVGKKPIKRSLGYGLRDAKGRIDKDAELRVKKDAEQKYLELIGKAEPVTRAGADLTIAQGWELAIDPDKGKWNKDTPHRRELKRCIDRAKGVLGPHRTWNSIERGDLRMLWRKELARVRATKRPGARSAHLVVSRLLSVAAWLREEGKIAVTACLPWKAMWEEMGVDIGEYTPKRLRYTLDEFNAILQASWQVNQRIAFALLIGAEYRLGQVIERVHRRHLDFLEGTLTIAGRGKKRGTIIYLTTEQLADTWWVLHHGYLAALEQAFDAGTIQDYPFFPERLRPARSPKKEKAIEAAVLHASRESMDSNSMREWFNEAEKLAGVTHVPGRGWVGMRRTGVDGAKEERISREGLQEAGGWSTTQVPDSIYAKQQQAWAAKEAATVRARLRSKKHTNTPTMQNDAEASLSDPSSKSLI